MGTPAAKTSPNIHGNIMLPGTVKQDTHRQTDRPWFTWYHAHAHWSPDDGLMGDREGQSKGW